jgi:hypothetical protein
MVKYKRFIPGKTQAIAAAYGLAGTAVSFIPLTFVPLDWDLGPSVPAPLNDIGFDLGLVVAGIGFVGAATQTKATGMRLWWLGIGFGGILYLLPRMFNFMQYQTAKARAGMGRGRGLRVSPMTGRLATTRSGPARARGFGSYRAATPTTVPYNQILF